MNKKTELSFEQALERLETVVRELEDGTVPLDRSLSLYEEGVGLVRLCNTRLDEAERRITVLTKREDGSYDEKSFGSDPS